MLFRILAVLLFAIFSTPSHGEDTVLAVQKKLTSLGFYHGEPDVVMGSQTCAAIRRYQISENLKVTGQMNRQTLTRLGIAGTSAASVSYVPMAEIFKGGPCANAATDAKVDTIKEAQKNLTLLGYYSGPEDGVGNTAMVTAIRLWQKSGGFRETGRLDSATLKGLDLIKNSSHP